MAALLSDDPVIRRLAEIFCLYAKGLPVPVPLVDDSMPLVDNAFQSR